MKVQATYKGKTVEIDIPDEKLEELIKEQKKTGWERPTNDETYWVVCDNGVEDYAWHDDDEDCYISGNCFTSEELAENIARYQSLDRRIRRRIAEICEPVDWTDNETIKFYICFKHPLGKFAVNNSFGNHCHGWYCDTEAHAEHIIDEFREELMWYFTEFKDRMDG